jgi:hypothetical protein
VASCIRVWLDDGLTTRQASTVENYRRLADHAIGKLGAVKGRGRGLKSPVCLPGHSLVCQPE